MSICIWMEDLDHSVVCQRIYFNFVKNVSERKEVFPLIFLFKRVQAPFWKGYASTLQEEKYPVWTFLTENFHLKIISLPPPLRIPLILSWMANCSYLQINPFIPASCSFGCAAEPSGSEGRSHSPLQIFTASIHCQRLLVLSRGTSLLYF